MNTTETASIHCPYCGERIEIVVDCSVSAQEYIEDCEVCCKPMVMVVNIDEQGHILVDARDENAC